MNNRNRVLAIAAALFCVLAALVPAARAQFDFGTAADKSQPVKASLVADTAAVVAGKPFTVLVRLDVLEGWHVYWQSAGDIGDPPKIKWELPPGFKAGAIQWPLPHSHYDADIEMTTYILEHDVLLPVEITPPANLDVKEVTLKASLSWLVCEKICIPGEGAVELKLPTAKEAPPANEELLAKARARLPQHGPAPFQVAWDLRAEGYTLKLTGLSSDTKAEFFSLPAEGVSSKPKAAKVTGEGDAHLISVALEKPAPAAASAHWEGLLVTQVADGPRQGWMVASDGKLSTKTAAAEGNTPKAGGDVSGQPPRSFLAWLGAAFLGGLILNLMPCVLPVIALKIFGFVNQAGEHPERVFRLGLSFVAGVFVFFLGLAAIAIALHSAGGGFFWGMQFSNPKLLIAIVAITLVFALSMLGVFEITLGGTAENTLGTLSRREGYGGAFVHGLFTTLLGTSCTAPFLGPMIGFAVAQPPASIVVLFLTIAVGMSLPYFLLTWQPAWMRFLPKPGAWMERFKQLVGFVLLAVVAWLFGSFAEGREASSIMAAGWFLVLISVACWFYGVRRTAGSLAVALLLSAAGGWLLLPSAMKLAPVTARSGEETNEFGIVWKRFVPAQVEELRKAGRPVFIDFTATWCANCKTNEGLVLNTEAVSSELKARGVETMKADWTRLDPIITEALRSFKRAGVPLYVLYRPGEEVPVLFPEILTKGMVVAELQKIAKP